MLIIIIPVYNEEKNIGRLLKSLEQRKTTLFVKRIILVDDGSIDQSKRMILSYCEALPISYIRLGVNGGPGRAFDRGLRKALKIASQRDFICTMEADTTSDITVLKRMINQLRSGSDVVLASCYSPYGGGLVGTQAHRMVLSRVANTFLKILFPIRGVYTYSSFYRIYKSHILRCLLSDEGHFFLEKGFACMVELLIRLSRYSITITEVPMVLHSKRRVDESKMKIPRTIFAYFRIMLQYGILDRRPIRANRKQ